MLRLPFQQLQGHDDFLDEGIAGLGSHSGYQGLAVLTDLAGQVVDISHGQLIDRRKDYFAHVVFLESRHGCTAQDPFAHTGHW